MEYVHLGDLIVAAKTNRCGDDDFPVLSITKSDGIVFQSEKFKKRIASKDTADYKVVRRGQLVQGIHIDEANFGIQEVVDIGIVSPAYKIWDIKSNAIVPKYLEIILRSPRSIAYYASRFNGSIKRRERLTDKDFLQMKIPCPPLEEQTYAIELLNKATTLIEQRKQQLGELDNLIKARFVELFGDPKKNEKGWEKGIVSDYYNVKGGKRIPKGMGYADGITNHPYLRATDMKNETIVDDDIHYIDEDVFQHIKRYTVNAGDIYLTNVGVHLGMAGVIPEKYHGASLTENAVKLVPKTERVLTGKFLAYYINSPGIQDYINERKMAVGVPKLAIFRIETMPLILPPMELQNQFTAFVEQVDKSKVVVQKAISKFYPLI